MIVVPTTTAARRSTPLAAGHLFRMLTVAVLAMTSACSTYHLPGQQPAPVEKQPDYTEVTPAPLPPTPQPDVMPDDPGAVAAYRPLLQKADAAAARGDYEQALGYLERAQRIDPDSAEIYLALAKTHSARGDRAQARATAERGLLYCRGQVQCEALRGYAD
ncbi:MAG: hypothetical protein Hals2KO_29500 [Halioglobus sp.]